MAPSFAEILTAQKNGQGKKPAIQAWAGRDTTPGVGREKAGGLYPVFEGPTKTIQMLEMAIIGIKALLNRALICRFNGYWPKLAEPHSWLDASWKPLLQQPFSIYPCARGFFVIDFDKQEDRSIIEAVGPWFWGSSGLFMQHWNPTFNPSTTSISTVSVWVRLPNLPLHLWNDQSLRTIGNAIGQFHSIYPNTAKFFRTTYACICLQMDLSEGHIIKNSQSKLCMDPSTRLRKYFFQMQVLLQDRPSGKGLPKDLLALQTPKGHMVDGSLS